MHYIIEENQVVQVELDISGVRIVIEKIKDLDNLINQVTDEEFNRDERLPYWAELWPSSLAMAEYILNNKDNFSGKKILELGSGLGLAGIAAHFAGGEVLFSDYEKQSLEFCRKNFYLNFKSYPETELIDWRKIKTNQSFEIIIASDVLYETRFIDPFLNAIENMCKTGGFVYITEPNRTIAKPFFKKINPGFITDFQKEFKIQNGNKLNTVTIYKLIRC